MRRAHLLFNLTVRLLLTKKSFKGVAQELLHLLPLSIGSHKCEDMLDGDCNSMREFVQIFCPHRIIPIKRPLIPAVRRQKT
ncbi:hypothetical protein M5K25_001931 [Dendrobium thyrsiflorum]|uniref:Secreted protein n=1 Tax=Dendrobium thyrsiflorum TaxID=117978 RepID=A0ABD0VT27_DENTH